MALNGATSTMTLVPATVPVVIKPGLAILLDQHGHLKPVEHLLYITAHVATVKEEEMAITIHFNQDQHILVNTLHETWDLENRIQNTII